MLTDDSPEACTDDIARINTSVSQLSHMNDMSVRDVFALVILMGLYLSTASGHQKAYKELLAYIDAGNPLTLVWAPTLLTTTLITESPLLCLSVLRCLLSWERTGHLLWRAIYLEGYLLGGLCYFVCVILSFFSCLRGWINFLFATRWSTPFMEIIIPIPYSIFHTLCYM